MTSFDQALQFVLDREAAYCEPPKCDQPTNRGITLPTLEEWRKEACTVDDLKALSLAETTEIYLNKYWMPCDCDSLPDNVALCVFDAAVNSGPPKSIKWLQCTVKVPQDGVIGPVTLAAVKARSPADICDALLSIRLNAMQDMAGWKVYGKGWLNRIMALRSAAFGGII